MLGSFWAWALACMSMDCAATVVPFFSEFKRSALCFCQGGLLYGARAGYGSRKVASVVLAVLNCAL